MDNLPNDPPESDNKPPPETHPYMQIVKRIRETWIFPKYVGLQQPFMYGRVTWGKQSTPNVTNN